MPSDDLDAREDELRRLFGSAISCALALVCVGSGCGGAGPSAPAATAPAAPPLASAAPSPPAAPPARGETSPFNVTAEGELATPGEISFGVRPLSGPGSMGPAVLTPESDVALAHVQKYMEAHPDQPLRIECSINVFRTSSGPNSAYAARLANLTARWLVDHGASCRRLEAVGRLERAQDAPVQKVRVLVQWGSGAPDAREDPCQSR